jgi:hypothetical protein
LVLRGVDGLVFVADSQVAKMDENIESLKNLKDNLEEYGYDVNQIPLVIQYNKRDLPNIASIAELEKILNPGGLPYFEAVAVTGDGVFKTLKAISKIVLDQVKAKKMDTPKIIKTPQLQPQPESQPQAPSQPKVLAKQQAQPQVPSKPQVQPQPQPQPRPQPQPQPQAAREPVGVGVGEASSPRAAMPSPSIKSEVIDSAVEVPANRIKSSDKIGTSQVESAVISDIPARVVVSDAPEDENHDHEESEIQSNVEETTERAEIKEEEPEPVASEAVIGQVPGLTNQYYDSESEVQSTQPKSWPSYGGMDDSDELSTINLKSPLPLRKPQMAESRKVKNKGGKFNLFGWLKKSKK